MRVAPALGVFLVLQLSGDAGAGPGTGVLDAPWAPRMGGQPVTVRVALASRVERVRVSSASQIRIRAGANGWRSLNATNAEAIVSLSGQGGAPVEVRTGGVQQLCSEVEIVGAPRTPLSVRAVSQDTGRVCLEGGYWGSLALVVCDGGMTVVNQVAIDDYLPGVLGREMGAGAHPEALRAQAIASRSYALACAIQARSDAGGSLPWDLRCDVRSQVYGGVSSESPSTRAAVRDTAGLVLTVDGRVLKAVYHASSGGVTGDPLEVWQEVIPGVTPVYDGIGQGPSLGSEALLRAFLLQPPASTLGADHPYFRWRVRYTAGQLEGILARALPRMAVEGSVRIGRLQDIQLGTRSVDGRVRSVRFVGSEGSATVRGDAIRWAFGTGVPGEGGLRSSLFVMDRAGQGPPYSAYEFLGGGWGHGLGMSQAGAMDLARRGLEARRILAHYYRGAEITHLAEGDGR